MASTLNTFLKKQPNLIKKISYKLIPFRLRYGDEYNKFLKLLNISKKWSYDEALNYQLNKLKEILNYSEKYVPYYNKLFRECGFNSDIRYFDDLKKIPILTKDIINNNFDSFISEIYKGKKYEMFTSGTTGKRLKLYTSDSLFKIEAAFITNAFNDHDAKLYDKHSIWIRRYSPKINEPIFLNDLELNRTYMSAFHLNNESVHTYVDFINKSKSEILVSYPSTIYYLSILCEQYDLKLKHVKYLHGASEVCLPQWRNKIKSVFNIDIKMHYGQVEKISFAHQDKYDNFYKENLLYSYNEFDDENTIIGTGFYNNVMPLIRYKTNDKVRPIETPNFCSAFPKTIEDIIGRNGDMLIHENNSLVPAVNFYSFMSKIDEVDLFKIIQYRENKKIDFFIMKNTNYTKFSEDKLKNELIFRLGNLEINFYYVNSLERDIESPKFKAVSLI